MSFDPRKLFAKKGAPIPELDKGHFLGGPEYTQGGADKGAPDLTAAQPDPSANGLPEDLPPGEDLGGAGGTGGAPGAQQLPPGLLEQLVASLKGGYNSLHNSVGDLGMAGIGAGAVGAGGLGAYGLYKALSGNKQKKEKTDQKKEASVKVAHTLGRLAAHKNG
jgi:hypothetical protein